MKQPSRLGAVALALVVMVAAFALALPATAQESSATEIDSCTTLDEPGRYVLTDDITDSEENICIRILIDRVTLDGAGHTIDGVGTGTAIYAGEASSLEARNTVITDVTVTEWGNGIIYEAVQGGSIRDSVVESNSRGIQIGFFSQDVNVVNTAVVGNRIGISTLLSDDNITIEDTVLSNEIDLLTGGDEEGSGAASGENVTLDTARIDFDVDIPGGSTDIPDGNLKLSAVGSAPADPDDRRAVGQYVTVSSQAGNGTLTLTTHYTDEDVAAADVDEETLRLYRFTDGEWTEVPGSSVDTDANTVSAEFDDFSAFGDDTVLAPLGQIDDDANDDAEDGADTDNQNGTDTDATDGGASGDKSDDKHDDAGDGDDAGDADDSTDGDVVDVGAKDVVIDLGDVTIADFDLDGPGLQDEHIDHRTYSVGGFDIEIDGLSFTIGNTDYCVGHVTIDVEPFDVILENVTLGNGE